MITPELLHFSACLLSSMRGKKRDGACVKTSQRQWGSSNVFASFTAPQRPSTPPSPPRPSLTFPPRFHARARRADLDHRHLFGFLNEAASAEHMMAPPHGALSGASDTHSVFAGGRHAHSALFAPLRSLPCVPPALPLPSLQWLHSTPVPACKGRRKSHTASVTSCDRRGAATATDRSTAFAPAAKTHSPCHVPRAATFDDTLCPFTPPLDRCPRHTHTGRQRSVRYET